MFFAHSSTGTSFLGCGRIASRVRQTLAALVLLPSGISLAAEAVAVHRLPSVDASMQSPTVVPWSTEDVPASENRAPSLLEPAGAAAELMPQSVMTSDGLLPLDVLVPANPGTHGAPCATPIDSALSSSNEDSASYVSFLAPREATSSRNGRIPARPAVMATAQPEAAPTIPNSGAAPLNPPTPPPLETGPGPVDTEQTTVLYSLRPDDPYVDNWNPRQEAYLSRRSIFGNLEFITRNGPLIDSGGFFENHIRTGWAFEGAFRQPVGNPAARRLAFLELGGAYHGNYGTGAIEPTSGTFTDPDATIGITQFLPHFRDTKLESLRRPSVFMALGWYFQPERFHRPGVSRLKFNWRIGGRWGHVSARFSETPSADLQTLVATQNALHALFGTPANYLHAGNVDRSSISVGIFTAGGFSYTRYGVQLGPLFCREFSVGADLMYNHDWFDLGDFGAIDNGLGVFSPMFSVSLAY